MFLPLLDEDATAVHIEGLDKLADLAGNHHQLSEVLGVLTGLVAVILIFGTPIIIVIAVLRARSKRAAMQNEVVLRLAEKGQPIPPELFLEPQRQRSDVSSGLSLIGIGLGLAVGFLFSGAQEAVGFALIPFFIGLARLISWKLEKNNSSKGL